MPLEFSSAEKEQDFSLLVAYGGVVTSFAAGAFLIARMGVCLRMRSARK
jgi:hypothetical protein